VDLIVYICRVELLTFFLFHLSYFYVLFACAIPHYVVNQVEYNILDRVGLVQASTDFRYNLRYHSIVYMGSTA